MDVKNSNPVAGKAVKAGVVVIVLVALSLVAAFVFDLDIKAILQQVIDLLP